MVPLKMFVSSTANSGIVLTIKPNKMEKTELNVNGNNNRIEKIEMNCRKQVLFDNADDYLDYVNEVLVQNKNKSVDIIIHCTLNI